QMYFGALEKVGVDAVGGGVRAEPRQGCARRFLHYFAQLSRKRQRAGTRHPRCLDKEHLATRRCPRQPDRDAWLLRPLLHLLVEKSRRAQELDDDLGGDVQRGLVAFSAPPRGFAEQRTNFALQISDAGFARISPDDQP